MIESITLDPPLAFGNTTLVRWIEGHTYESDTGATYYSGATDPSAADAEDCLANPRTPPSQEQPPREISKLTLRRRIRALGKESLFDATLDSMPNARADWDDAQVLRTDDPLFTTYATDFKASLGLTDAEFATLIS